MAEHSPSKSSKTRRRRKKEAEEQSAAKPVSAAGGDGREDVLEEASGCDSLSRCSERTDDAHDEQATLSVSKKKKKQKQKQKLEPPPSELTGDSVAVFNSQQAGSELSSTSKLPGGKSGSMLEEELQWCVWQLELGILRLDASKAQRQENERHLRTLNSPKAPLARKRQLMRSLFGDYRSKMKQQPFPHAEREPKIVAVKRSTAASSATYFRKAAPRKSLSSAHSLTLDTHNGGTAMADATFCFNFDIP